MTLRSLRLTLVFVALACGGGVSVNNSCSVPTDDLPCVTVMSCESAKRAIFGEFKVRVNTFWCQV